MATPDAVAPPPPGFEIDPAHSLPPGFALDAPAPTSASAAPGTSFLDQLKRTAGLTARTLAPIAAGAGAGAAMGSIVPGVGTALGAGAGVLAMGGAQLIDAIAGGDHAGRLMDAMGLPRPETTGEKVTQAAIGGMAGAGGTAAAAGELANVAASPLAKHILNAFAEAPVRQVLSGGAANTASTLAAAIGVPPAVQTGAALVAGALPFEPEAVGVGVRHLLRGGDENVPAMIERAKTLAAAGVTAPSAGQVTGGRTAQATESLLTKTPGGAGPMVEAAQKQATEIGAKATSIADKLSTKGTPFTAGNIIEDGIGGEGGFVSRGRQIQANLYDKLDQYFPATAPVPITNTQRVLGELNKEIAGFPSLSQRLASKEIAGIEADLRSDMAGGAPTPSAVLGPSGAPIMTPGTPAQTDMPYAGVKQFRTKIGDKLDTTNLTSDVPKAMWNRLYGALSQDMKDAARATGNNAAIKAMNRANSFTTAFHDRIDNILNKVVKDKTPEKIYANATSIGDMDKGATKIATVLKSLRPAERDVVKSVFIRDMGAALPGQQSAAVDVWSSQRFLTNWARMSPAAKAVMFSGGQNEEVRTGLDQIAKAAEYIREGSKVFANPSGTASVNIQTMATGGIAGALASGHWEVATALLTGAAAANQTAKMMTSPTFVKWLANATTLTPAAMPAAIRALATSIKVENDPALKHDVGNYLAGVVANKQPAPAQPTTPVASAPLPSAIPREPVSLPGLAHSFTPGMVHAAPLPQLLQGTQQ